MSSRLRQLVGTAFSLFERHPYQVWLPPPGTDEQHLDSTIGWLARAQDACKGQGVSILFDRHTGWAKDPYPETSGYILATFLKYSQITGNKDFYNRAVAIGEWEIQIQREDGAVLSSVTEDRVRVFNTGQVILGWCALFEVTKDVRYLIAAKRAAIYLKQTQEMDGSWVQDTYCGARTYHARVAWGLLRLSELSGEESFADTAYKNLGWVLRQQNSRGWFANCGFLLDPPITHVIGYTIRGLLECHQIAQRVGFTAIQQKLWNAIVPACKAIASCVQQYRVNRRLGLVPSAFDDTWRPAGGGRDSCLTGNAQLAICLMRFAQIGGDTNSADAAYLLVDALKTIHDRNNPNSGIRGGVAGSFPFHRGYLAGKFPNWAAKFFADALIMRINHMDGFWVNA